MMFNIQQLILCQTRERVTGFPDLPPCCRYWYDCIEGGVLQTVLWGEVLHVIIGERGVEDLICGKLTVFQKLCSI